MKASPEQIEKLKADAAEAMKRFEEARLNSKREFHTIFINRPLEPYADLIFDYFSLEVTDRVDAYMIKSSKEGLIENVRDNLNIAYFAKSIRSGSIKGSGFCISNVDDVRSLKESVDSLLVFRLSEPFKEIELQKGFTSITKITDNWHEAIYKLPREENVIYNDEYIDDSCLDNMISCMENFLKEAKDLEIVTQETRVVDFLKKVQDMGIPMNNKFYRDFYDCLVYFGLIPAEVKEAHDKTPSKYVRENYIKLKFKRALHQTSDI